MGQRFLICAYSSPDSDFFTGESNIIVRWLWFEVKNVLMLDLFLTNTVNTQLLTSLDINWWTGVVWIIVMFYQLFDLSFWRHPFTAEDPL